MRIKPTYDKSFIVRYRRNGDVQSTEIVEASRQEVCMLISRSCGDKMTRPRTAAFIPTTQVQVIELDNIRKQSQKVYDASIYNLSPREVRIRLENELRQ